MSADLPGGIEKLIRSHLSAFAGYSASTSPETLKGKVEVPVEGIIKLDANENPYGCSPKVIEALAGYTDFNVYPDNGQAELREMLAGYTGAGPDSIVASGGSNLLIDLIVRLFVGAGDEVINCVPTFDVYRFSTDICGGKTVDVPRDGDFAVDVGAVKRAVSPNTRLIFLANPNSPTGNLTAQKDILEILDMGLPTLVDEAYYEFSGETVLPLTSRYPNLMVLRTFSKWAGLAGLRIGYGIFPPRIAAYLMAIKMPYNVSVAAHLAVRESLKDIDYLRGKVEAIIAERERLFAELGNIDFLKPFPSRGNFILCRVLRGEAKELHQKLQSKGILVRYFDKPLVQNCIRISVGKLEHTDAVIRALRELGGETGG
ncbi:histidinol-phosphate transaminase [Bacteroidota bacterium]